MPIYIEINQGKAGTPPVFNLVDPDSAVVLCNAPFEKVKNYLNDRNLENSGSRPCMELQHGIGGQYPFVPDRVGPEIRDLEHLKILAGI